VVSGGDANSVYLLSLTPEILRKRFFLLSMPSTLPVKGSDVNALLDELRAAPNALLLAQSNESGKPAAVFEAKP
jgi:hypothetical protein